MNEDWTMEATLDITIPKLWFDFCQSSDLFMTDHCGYWLYGVSIDKNKTWLVYDQGDDGRPTPGEEHEAILRFSNREYDKLPKGFMLFGTNQMIEAYKHAVRLWGINWEEQADALYYDKIIQLTLLGEHRYG